MKNAQRGSIVLWITAVIVIIIGVGLYCFSQNNAPYSSTTTPNSNLDWKTYTNARNNYELKYPANWKVGENQDGLAYLLNPLRPGKADTDQPAEVLSISFPQAPCKDSPWSAGFAFVNYKITCVSLRNGQTATINSVAFDEEGKSIEDRIVSSIK